MTAAGRPLGDRLIVLYKVAKAALELALAVALAVAAARGQVEALREEAALLRAHVTSHWAVLAGRWLGALVSARGVHLVELGLILDAALTAFEGWSLWHGAWWGAWVVVVATGGPLPLEVVALARHARAGRALLLLVNAAVVAYLAWRIARRRPPRRHPDPGRAAVNG